MMTRGWIAYSQIRRRISGRRHGKSVNEVDSDITLSFERCPKVFVTIFRSWELDRRKNS
jgi:hypothetical protein